MAGFKSTYENTIDGKGRMAVPAKMRRAMNPEAKDTMVITRGFEQCLFLYPLDRWAQVEEELGQLNAYQQEARAFRRIAMMWADEQVLDKQGRVMLSRRHLDYAGLSDRAVVVGALDHIEVWDPDVLDAHLNQTAPAYESLAESVMGGF